MRPALPTLATALVLLLGTGGEAAAQYRSDVPVRVSWPEAPTSLELLEPQATRLPIYDDAGEPISYALVASLVDESGLKGALWLGLGMSLAGALIGAAITSYDCPVTTGSYRYECSPREEAMRSAVTGGLTFTFGLLGAWWGWNIDRTTWDEALEQIREARRSGVMP